MSMGLFTLRGDNRIRSFPKGVISMKLSKTLLASLVVVLAVSVLSCGKREDAVLAEFKNRSITIGEFEDAYSKVDVKFLPNSSGEEGLKEFLNTMLNKEVMAYKADELGYDKDRTVIQGMDSYRKLGLQAGYMKFKVADKVTVTEEEILEHYRNKGATLSIKQILVDTPDEAEEIYQLLLDGADFETVCRENSKAPDADQGGQVMTVVYGSFNPDMQKEMFKLPVGGITKPVYTPYGFFVVKVIRRAETKMKPPIEDMRETLEAEVRSQNETYLMNEVSEGIRQDAGVTWFWENLRIAFTSLPPDRSLVNPPDRRDEVYPLLYFEEDDLDKPIVSYKDKVVTIKDFSDYYDRSSFFRRPRREFRFSGIKHFLTEFIMAELVEEEMVRSNIEEEPEVKRVMTAKREELMINRLYEDMINAQTTVNERMIQDYYNQNEEYFQVAEKRRFGVILTGDLESAQAAYGEIKGGKRFRIVAKQYSIDEPTLENLAETELLVEGEQPEIDRVGFALGRVGEVSEPFETSRGWMILKLTEKADAGSHSLDEARESIRHALKQLENENRLNELLAKWKEELGVEIREDNFKKVQVEERSVTDKPAV
jgi:parvulin-like peptidyl-prolyl isomerase